MSWYELLKQMRHCVGLMPSSFRPVFLVLMKMSHVFLFVPNLKPPEHLSTLLNLGVPNNARPAGGRACYQPKDYFASTMNGTDTKLWIWDKAQDSLC